MACHLIETCHYLKQLEPSSLPQKCVTWRKKVDHIHASWKRHATPRVLIIPNLSSQVAPKPVAKLTCRAISGDKDRHRNDSTLRFQWMWFMRWAIKMTVYRLMAPTSKLYVRCLCAVPVVVFTKPPTDVNAVHASTDAREYKSNATWTANVPPYCYMISKSALPKWA